MTYFKDTSIRDILRYGVLIFLLAALSWGCTVNDKVTKISPSLTKKNKLDIRVMGIHRHYLLHVPSGYTPDKKIPLVIAVHGAFSTPAEFEKQSGLSKVADKEYFLVAYPSGAFGMLGFFKHWNAGHCCGKAVKDNIDDTGFLLKVIDDIKSNFTIDINRVYMVGFSNGGMLTYRFAAEHTERLAAAAVLGASLGGKASTKMPLWITPIPKSPLPVIIFHAKDDLSVPYNGGISLQKGGEREYISVAESVDFWVNKNKCDLNPKVEYLYDNRIVKKEWIDHKYGNNIQLYTIDNWGHRWPGKYYSDYLDGDDPLKGFSAADVIWSFFKDQSRKNQ